VVVETSSGADLLEFGLLGPLGVTRAGTALPLGGRQQRAVLAVLLADAGTAVSVGRIAEAVWGERAPVGFASTVQTYVFHLREVLEPSRGRGAPGQLLVTESGGYRLRVSDDAIDAAVFEQRIRAGQEKLARAAFAEAAAELSAALGLWRGEVLADLADFEFVAPIAARLTQLRQVARQSRIDADLALGRHSVVLAELDELVARHPLNEQMHAARILALYRTGRQSDALEAYGSLRTILRDELGIDPSPQLQQLHREVLAQDPKLDWQPPPPSGNGRRSGVAGIVPSKRADGRAPAGVRSASRRRLRWVLGGSLAAALVVAGSISAVVADQQHHSSLRALPANSVGTIHTDGSLHDAIAVGPNPSAVAYGAGTVWVTSSTEGRVARVDSGTHRVVETIRVGRSPTAIAVTEHDAWVVNAGDGTVSRISTDTDDVVRTIQVGTLPSAIAAGPSGVWVTNSGDDSIQRIDPVTGDAGPPIPVGGRPGAIAVNGHAVWVANTADGSVTEIDPDTGQDLSGPIAVGSGPGSIAVTGSAVWVANTDDQSVVRLDPQTRRVVARVPVGDGPSSIAVTSNRLWVGNAYDGTLTELDSTTNTVRHRFAIGASPRAMVAAGSSVWVASGAFAATTHVGGTLTVTGPGVPGNVVGIDPANEYLQSMTLRALRLVYDGLVSYHVAGGPAGLTIVPDLATAVPRPSDGGRTYSFTLRRGVRYSDGTPVRASDIQRGVLRSLTVGTSFSSPGGFASAVGIVGAEQCGQPHSQCDLSRGVVVDDATGSVVFHLNAPDPHFLFKLSYFGQATAPGAPATETKTPLPGTGPYRVSQYRQGDTFVLTRNPYFRQWSFAAQPAGYPDTIRWVKTPDTATAIVDVLAGRADLVRLPEARSDALSQRETEQIQQRHPAQLHTENPFGLHWMYLNTREPPFDDRRVRQAINYAIDRRRLVEIYGGAARATPTCQMLQPDFPGYQPYCPFSTGPPDEPYAGPDRAKARALVAASGTQGMAITLTGTDDPFSHATNTYLVNVLRSLGYAARLHELTDDDYFGLESDPQARWQILQGSGFFADYPAASNFYLNLFSCAATTGPGAGRNCNRGLDALADDAYHAEGTDPSAARTLWAAVDRKLTDDAPFVALVNTLEATAVSQRVGNYQSSPELGPLLSQIWVR
jgi:YVTN family beta-propeller protein